MLNLRKIAQEESREVLPLDTITIAWSADPQNIVPLVREIESRFHWTEAGGMGYPADYFKPGAGIYFDLKFGSEEAAKGAFENQVLPLLQKYNITLSEKAMLSAGPDVGGDYFLYQNGNWVKGGTDIPTPDTIEVSGEGLTYPEPKERLPLPGEKFDLPENLPPGIAVRLNMKKDAV